MLYATTRSKTDSYTAYRTLHSDRAPDGGFFVPYRMPVLDHSEILKLKDQSFSESVAQILNLFFSIGLTAWDVDCAIGRNAVKIISLNQKVSLVNLWDNPKGDYDYIIQRLYERICDNKPEKHVTDWAHISIRIAVLFGIYSVMQNPGITAFDISVNTGDFSVPMAAWYARYMGLPIRKIVCGCNENNAPWDFLHRGEMNTGLNRVSTEVPELDVANPAGLERLVYATLGYDEAQKYVKAAERKGCYYVHPDMLDTMNQGMFVSVISKGRPEAVITSVFKSAGCIIDPYTAVSYGGLQDYRAKIGEGYPTLLLWEKSPAKFLSVVQSATGLSGPELENKLLTV